MPADAATIVFDLDGTLVDSAPDLVAALNVILRRDGVNALPFDVARGFVGHGGRALIRRGLAADGREVSDNQLETMFVAFLAQYEAHIADGTRLFPGVETTLDGLAADGYRIAVLTNKYERSARKLIAALGQTARFAMIAGQDTFAVSKPNGAALRLTVEAAGGDPSRVVMVGDTATDVATARDAGVPAIAVNFGYSREPVASLGADAVIGHFDELRDAIARIGMTRRADDGKVLAAGAPAIP